MPKASAVDVGCWINGTWGHYAPTRLIEIAKENGFAVTHEEQQAINAYVDGDDGDYEMITYLSDQAEAWMNQEVAPGSHAFGWHDGEFYLWSDKDWREV